MVSKHYIKKDLTIQEREISSGLKKGLKVISLSIEINEEKKTEIPTVEINMHLEKSKKYVKDLEGRLYIIIHLSNLQEYNAFVKYCNIIDNDTTTCDRTHFEIETIKVFELNYNDSNEDEVLDKYSKIVNDLWNNYIDLLEAVQFIDKEK